MKPDKGKVGVWVVVLLLWAASTMITGCVAATKLVKNEKVDIKTDSYRELYFIKPEKDPRNVLPKVVEEFRSMGLNVREIEPGKPIEGIQGTGFLISDEGDIVTCAHVIEEEQTATVWIGGVRYEADVVNRDKDIDIALLKTRSKIATGYTPLSFRSDKTYALGEDVSTIGFPMTRMLGDAARLSKGLISSTVGKKGDPKQVQFSAQVQPGNSGGPLFDNEGVVVGVVQETLNPWKMAQTTGGSLPQNVNFAIKSDFVLDSIKSSSETTHQKIRVNHPSTLEQITNAVGKVRSGIIPEELEKAPKLVAELSYYSFWDIWFRFRYFVVSVYDFDTQELLFRAGQVRDNMASNEDVVIKDTMLQVRRALNRTAPGSTDRLSVEADGRELPKPDPFVVRR
jgi:S1-C subfamily serine protease